MQFKFFIVKDPDFKHREYFYRQQPPTRTYSSVREMIIEARGQEEAESILETQYKIRSVWYLSHQLASRNYLNNIKEKEYQELTIHNYDFNKIEDETNLYEDFELKDFVKKMLNKLPEHLRHFLELYYLSVNEPTKEEIAEQLNLRRKTREGKRIYDMSKVKNNIDSAIMKAREIGQNLQDEIQNYIKPIEQPFIIGHKKFIGDPFKVSYDQQLTI